MKYNTLKLSALSLSVAIALAGCGGDKNEPLQERPDSAPIANDVAVVGAKQWQPMSASLDVFDAEGDAMIFNFREDGVVIEPNEQGVYQFSHGEMTLDGKQVTYVSYTGENIEIPYTVTANRRTAQAMLSFSGFVTDPLANEQWHLRNTGQKAYSLSDSMKKALVDLMLEFGQFETEEEAYAFYDEEFALAEAEALKAGEDMNVAAAIKQGVTGEGMIAVVVDSGLELSHEDLVDNVLPNRSLNLNADALNRMDPSNPSVNGDHGTSVAGLIAAKGWNGKGGRGVAPDTQLIGMNYLGGSKVSRTDLFVHGFPGSGISTSENIAVFNRSYGLGWPTHFSYSVLDEAIESYPNLNLRNGLGALNMKSSGNSFISDGPEGSFCRDNGAQENELTCYNGNFEPSQQHHYYLSIAAVNANGKHTSYSTAGANVFVSAPAGEYGRWAPAMITTDQMTCLAGYSSFNSSVGSFISNYGEAFAAGYLPFNYPGHVDNPSCNYTNTFNGTSSAAPNASGVVSLILSANPNLSWREVRHILAKTSTMNDADDAPVELNMGTEEEPILFTAHQGWITNAAGYNFNQKYGFGRVDAGAAVTMAKSYDTSLAPEVNSGWIGAGSVVAEDALTVEIPDNDVMGVSYTIDVEENMNIEAIQFKFDVFNDMMRLATAPVVDVNGNIGRLQTTAGTDLAIEVTSPSGTKAMLLSSKQAFVTPAYTFGEGYNEYYILKDGVFLANAFYGESSAGTWTIRLVDTNGNDFVSSDNGNNASSAVYYMNNENPSVLEGAALRVFGTQGE